MEEASRLRASRKAHRSHLTQIFGKIEEILQSDAIPNEKQTATLKTSLQQIEAKRATVEELDSRISDTIQDPEALESEILDAEDIQFNVAEKITLIKAVLARSTPLNVQAAPFQPQPEILFTHESLTDDQEPPLNEDEEPLREGTPVRNTPHDTRDGGRSVHTGTSARQETPIQSLASPRTLAASQS